MIIDDKNDANDVANGQLVHDATLCVDVIMVHTTLSDLVTSEIHIESPLLHLAFGLLIGTNPYFFVVDVDLSQVMLHKIIYKIWSLSLK